MCVHVLVTGSDIIHEAFWWGFVVSRLAIKAGPLFVAGTKKSLSISGARSTPALKNIYIYHPCAGDIYAGSIIGIFRRCVRRENSFFAGGERGNIMFLFVAN